MNYENYMVVSDLSKEKLTQIFVEMDGHSKTINNNQSSIDIWTHVNNQYIYGCILNLTGNKSDIEIKEDTLCIHNINQSFVSYFTFDLNKMKGFYTRYRGGISLSKFSTYISDYAKQKKLIQKKEYVLCVKANKKDIKSFLEEEVADIKFISILDKSLTENSLYDQNGFILKEVILHNPYPINEFIDKFKNIFSSKKCKIGTMLKNGKSKKLDITKENQIYEIHSDFNHDEFLNEISKYGKKENFHQNKYLKDLIENDSE
ncbi:hypothetical protein L3V83_14560 [Thiotrichales bacterium 19X7-9]|nr:hypothetical protein [Thiotrichales bacterium 19X7-9]